MTYKGIEKLLNIGWGWMVLLMIVFPIAGMFAQFVLLFVELYSENGFLPIPIMMLPILIIMLVYFGWQYVISIRLNHKFLVNPLPTRWFFICLTHILIWALLMTSIVAFPNLFNDVDVFIAEWLYMVTELFAFVYFFSVVASYGYLCYFTSKVLSALFKDKEKEPWILESFPYFMTVWVFPFGIPFFNRKIERHYKPKQRAKRNIAKPSFEPRTFDKY